MKRFFSLLTVLALLVTAYASVAAQATPVTRDAAAAPFLVPGLKTAATMYSVDGGPVGRVSVVSVERGWTGFDKDYGKPDAGKEWVFVTVSVENVSQSTIDLDSDSFLLYDEFGRPMESETPSTSDQRLELFSSASVEPNSSMKLPVMFQMYKNSGLGMFTWVSSDGTIAQVVLSDI